MGTEVGGEVDWLVEMCGSFLLMATEFTVFSVQ